jgi:hypothetical protein
MPSTLSPFSRVNLTQIVLSLSAHQVMRGLLSETFAITLSAQGNKSGSVTTT